MDKFGQYVKFITHEGKRDELAQNLLQVAENMHMVEGCNLYVINLSTEDENTLWVTEIWSNKEAHQASLSLEGSKEYIAASLPLIKQVDKVELKPLGGFGLN
ncbi:antibiotic biosynthesis monooxygenase [Shimazuella sp. AN120528]|uniref:putative quinol monooxygenase n=1 Tax=Shimazuella soli TaxID=1892854 RepID=UPI001F114FDB|nr:antibiotic biosynthesis monooxygenase [Shimazuella soli]MCH5585769.1 antibiotic biosynthesis monooxygenase [Shimazuella soli]